MTTPTMYRQGDVLLIALTTTPPNLIPVDREHGRIILAHGEATGHAHAILGANADLFTHGNQRCLLVNTSEHPDVRGGGRIAGETIDVLPSGELRFRRDDGLLIRFQPGDVIREPDGTIIADADFTLLIHDEHDALPLRASGYSVVQQREYLPEAIRNVAD